MSPFLRGPLLAPRHGPSHTRSRRWSPSQSPPFLVNPNASCLLPTLLLYPSLFRHFCTQVSGDLAEVFESGFEVFDPSTLATASSRSARARGRPERTRSRIDDFLSRDIRVGEIVKFFKAFASVPEDVEAGDVAVDKLFRFTRGRAFRFFSYKVVLTTILQIAGGFCSSIQSRHNLSPCSSACSFASKVKSVGLSIRLISMVWVRS